MRVGVNTLFLIPGEVGGSETYVRKTLKAMARLFQELEFVLFTNRESDALFRDDLAAYSGVTFFPTGVRARRRSSRIIREQLQLPGLAGRAGIDILWSPGYTAPLFCPCPTVTSILDMQYRRHPEDLTLPARIATDILVRAACRRSGGVIAISEFSRREILAFSAASPEKITVTHLAAAPEFGEPVPESERRSRVRALLGGDGPYLLIVSNTYPHKNVEAAVRAFGALQGRIPHRLVIVGKPRLGEARVQAALAALTDRDQVVRLFRVEGERDLVALYQHADVFLFPSLYEGFGLPVLEAMAAGVPVVAADTAAVREVAGEVPLYFDAGNEGDIQEKVLMALALSAGDRQRAVAAGRAMARRYSWEETARATVEFFRQVLAV